MIHLSVKEKKRNQFNDKYSSSIWAVVSKCLQNIEGLDKDVQTSAIWISILFPKKTWFYFEI